MARLGFFFSDDNSTKVEQAIENIRLRINLTIDLALLPRDFYGLNLKNTVFSVFLLLYW